jgi:hypothetical protein
VKDWTPYRRERKFVQDPTDLFTTELQATEAGLVRPVLVEALDGFVDAGNGRRLAREHLLNALDSQLMVSFDVDQLLDYRARRPEMTFTTDHWSGYAAPQLAIHLVHDLNHVPFLLLHGPEPDVQWERFIAAVRRLVAELDVRLVIGLNAIPMAVPHTRPSTVIAHGTPVELVAGYPKWLPTVQVPASVGSLLEYRIGQDGTPACGFAVAVPYYLANLDFPAAAHTLVTSVASAGELSLPSEALAGAAGVVRPTLTVRSPTTTKSPPWCSASSSSTTISPIPGVACSPTEPDYPRPTSSAPNSRTTCRTGPTSIRRRSGLSGWQRVG